MYTHEQVPSRPAVAAYGSQPRGAAERPPKWDVLFLRREPDRRRLSASTLEAYTLDLAALSHWARAHEKELSVLTTADLGRYFAERLASGASSATVARQLSTCRRFYAYLQAQCVVASSPAAAVRLPRFRRVGATPIRAELLELLLTRRPGRHGTAASAYRALRDYTIIRMLYATDLGVTDVRLLRWAQVDDAAQVVRVPFRSGAIRTCALDAGLLGVFRDLHGKESGGFDLSGSAYCFPTASGLPMTRQALCHLVRKVTRECGGADLVTPSLLRQTGRAHKKTAAGRLGTRPPAPAGSVA